jgi:hypothetical protein
LLIAMAPRRPVKEPLLQGIKSGRREVCHKPHVSVYWASEMHQVSENSNLYPVYCFLTQVTRHSLQVRDARQSAQCDRIAVDRHPVLACLARERVFAVLSDRVLKAKKAEPQEEVSRPGGCTSRGSRRDYLLRSAAPSILSPARCVSLPRPDIVLQPARNTVASTAAKRVRNIMSVLWVEVVGPSALPVQRSGPPLARQSLRLFTEARSYALVDSRGTRLRWPIRSATSFDQ